MSLFITQDKLKLIKKLSILLILCLGATACDDDARSRLQNLGQGKITLPSGKELTVYIARSPKEQIAGLSRLQPKDFFDTESMLFLSSEDKVRQFWMPETHFDLDIIFLTKDLYVLDIHRKLEHFPKKEPKRLIPLSKAVFSRHVLEVKSSSPLAREISPGMILKWSADERLLQIK